MKAPASRTLTLRWTALGFDLLRDPGDPGEPDVAPGAPTASEAGAHRRLLRDGAQVLAARRAGLPRLRAPARRIGPRCPSGAA